MNKMKGIITTTDPDLLEAIQKAFPDWLVLATQNGDLIKYWPLPPLKGYKDI